MKHLQIHVYRIHQNVLTFSNKIILKWLSLQALFLSLYHLHLISRFKILKL